MPDVPLKPDAWKKFSSGLQSDAPAEVSPSYMPQVQGALDFGRGVGRGAAKGVAGMIPESIEGKDWKDWSSSPGEGGAETAGEWTGDVGANVAPFFLAPELGIAAKGSELLGNLALAQRTAGNIGQKAYGAITKWGPRAAKFIGGTGWGAGAGATEAALHNEETKDPNKYADATKRGTVTGGVTAAEFTAGRLMYEALPPGIKHVVRAGAFGLTAGGAGVALYDELGHHHWVPHALLYGIAGPLLGVASGASRLPPGVIGAGAERAAQGTGYEPGGSQAPAEQGSDDELAPQ